MSDIDSGECKMMFHIGDWRWLSADLRDLVTQECSYPHGGGEVAREINCVFTNPSRRVSELIIYRGVYCAGGSCAYSRKSVETSGPEYIICARTWDLRLLPC